MTTYSFEFFPPKSEPGIEKLWAEVEALAASNPSFMTMTFGAGGSTRDGTLALARDMRARTKLPVASHLTFVCMDKGQVGDYLDRLIANDIRHVIALRGDIPQGWEKPDYTQGQHYQFTSEFVSALKARGGFEISVAAYPEKHPEAPSLEADIAALKLKCDAGADRAITQFFFDNDKFLRFRDQVAKAGITTPLVPGLLPIANFDRMVSFATACQAHVPAALHETFEKVKDKPEDALEIANDLLCRQAEGLVAAGVEHIHFYTLNRADMVLKACQSIA